MFRLSKLADYALVAMEHIARHPEVQLHTARSVAAATHLPAPTVAKILRELLDRDLLVSHRGVNGGYTLARSASQISLAEVIEAIEGPMGFTECTISPGSCELEGKCSLQTNFSIITHVLQQTLVNISLSDLTALLNVDVRAANRSNILTSITLSSGGVQ